MITLFREFTKSWIFKGLMVLLVASFAVFGLRDVFNKVGGDNVVTAGARTVTSTEFKSDFDRYKQNYEQQNQGQTLSNDQFVQSGDHVQMLNEIADQTAFSAWLDSVGVKPSAKMIVGEIAKIPAFFNSVTGRFDKDIYRQRLAESQMTEKQLDDSISDDIASQQYITAAVSGFKAPRIYAATQAAMNMQARDASVFIVNEKNVTMPTPPTDADLTSFYNSRLEQLKMPELRQASVVRFAPDSYLKSITIDETAVRKLYDDRLKTLATAEARSFVVVSTQSQADASAISAALKSGQTPDAAAKAHKGQVIAYDQKPQKDVPDAKIATAAFALKTGEVSDAVQGTLGFAVIKMGDIKTGSTPSYESLHAELAQDYVKEQAANRVNKDSNAFSDAVRAGKDFDATAKELGLTVVKLDPMTAQGQTNNPQVSYSKFTALVKAIYDLPSVGSASDVEELGEGQYFAVRLDVLKPAGAPPLNQIKGELAQYWMAEKVAAAVQDVADKAVERLKKGESFAAVAASLNAQVKPLNNLNRATIQQTGLPQALAGRIFSGQTGESFSTPLNQVNIAVGRIDAIHQADAQQANSMATMIGSQMTQSIQRDLAMTTRSAARTVVKTQVYPNTAAQALGVTPPDPKASITDKIITEKKK